MRIVYPIAALLLFSFAWANGPDTGRGSGRDAPAGGIAPVITVQPASQPARSGSGATFSVVATGDPAPSYQWFRNNQVIVGATGETYTLNPVKESDAGVYMVTVSNGAGLVISDPAILTVTF
jgi:hypothetical protein